MAALTADPGIILGAFHVQVMKRDANGYAKGILADPDTVVANTTSSALHIGSLDAFTAPNPTTEFGTGRGGQKLIGSMALGISSFGTPSITLAAFDETLNAFIKGTTADVTTITGWAMNAANSSQQIFPQLITIVTGKFLNTDTLGEFYLNWVFHNCQWVSASGPNTSQAGGVNPNPLTYNLNLSLSTRNITGKVFSSSTGMSVVDGTDTWTLIRTTWPLAVTTWVANGAATTFILGYRPVYSTVTTGTVDNSFTINGVATAPTSVSTTTGVVTVAGAGTTGDIHEAVYQTKFVAI
jgi:hypothetical protein